jgi:hypothetical protein
LIKIFIFSNFTDPLPRQIPYDNRRNLPSTSEYYQGGWQDDVHSSQPRNHHNSPDFAKQITDGIPLGDLRGQLTPEELKKITDSVGTIKKWKEIKGYSTRG